MRRSSRSHKCGQVAQVHDRAAQRVTQVQSNMEMLYHHSLLPHPTTVRCAMANVFLCLHCQNGAVAVSMLKF